MRKLIYPLVVLVLLALAPAAMARDRDRDRLPDSWERKHGLSTKAKSTRRDPDRDGLANLAEYRLKTDPRDDDSDDDGLEDGDEYAGTVLSYEDGTLVIGVADGTTLSGKVTDETRIKCRYEEKPDPPADKPDYEAEAEVSEYGSEEDPPPPPKPEPDYEKPECELRAGAAVYRADLTLLPGGRRMFVKVEIEGAPGT